MTGISSKSVYESSSANDPAENGIILHPWTLSFKNSLLERLYLGSQRNTLLRSLQVSHVVLCVLSVISFVPTQLEHSPPFLCVTDAISFSQTVDFTVFFWAVLILISLTRWRKKWSYAALEVTTIIGSVLTITGITLADPYRSALIFQEKPEEVWQNEYFSDSKILLNYDLVITAVHQFIPVRSSVSWLVPAIAALKYMTLTFRIGGPEHGGLQTSKLSIQLVFLGCFAWLGRWRMEKEARLAFAEKERLRIAVQSGCKQVEEEKKQKVQERVKRFDAERKLEIAQGHWAPTASGARPHADISSMIGPTNFGEVASDHGIQPATQLVAESSSIDSSTGPGSIITSAGSLDNSMPICFLPSSAELLCESTEDPGKLMKVQAATIRPGQQVFALDKSTGDLSQAKVAHIYGSQDLSRTPSWFHLTIAHGGAGQKLESDVVISTVVLVQKKCRFLWKAPASLALGEDVLYGVLLGAASAGSNDTIHSSSWSGQMRPATFDVIGKAQSGMPDFVMIQISEPSRYAPLLGCAPFSQDAAQPFIAVGSFARQEVKFTDASSIQL